MLVKFLGKGICMYRIECVGVFATNSSRVWLVFFSSSITFNVASNQPAPVRSLICIKYQKRKHFHSQLWILKTGDEREETESDAPAARETYPPEIVRELLSVLGTTHVQQVRHLSLLVSVFVSRSSGSGSSPGRGHCAVFLGKIRNLHSVSLHPGVQLNLMLGLTLQQVPPPRHLDRTQTLPYAKNSHFSSKADLFVAPSPVRAERMILWHYLRIRLWQVVAPPSGINLLS